MGSLCYIYFYELKEKDENFEFEAIEWSSVGLLPEFGFSDSNC